MREKNTWVQGGGETAVAIGFSADKPPKVIEDVLAPTSILRVLNANACDEPILFKQPLPLEMELAARHILLPGLHASLLRHFLVAKADELMCLGLDAILSASDSMKPPISEPQSKIRYVCQILETRIQRPPSVLELAQAVRLPANILARKFTETYGTSIARFLLHQRMKAALHALLTTNLPLKRISYDVGYRHVSNFCAAFKRHYGRTPTEMRLVSAQGPRRPDALYCRQDLQAESFSDKSGVLDGNATRPVT